MVFSINRIIFHVKKRWWVLIFAVLIGIGAYSLGVHKSKINLQGKNNIYEKEIILLSNEMNNTYIDNFLQITMSANNQKRILNGSKSKYDISLNKSDAGSIFVLNIYANKLEDAKTIDDNIDKIAFDQYNKYYPNVKINELNSIHLTEKNINNRKKYLELNNLLMLFFPIMLAVIILYIFMVFDKRIYGISELEQIVKMPVFNNKKDDFIKKIKDHGAITLVIGKGIECLKDSAVKNIELEDFLMGDKVTGDTIICLKLPFITIEDAKKMKRIINCKLSEKIKIFLIQD